MAGFQHDIAGGSGNLIVTQLQSPNFSLAGETGWAILQNGDAYFFNITASGSVTTSSVIVQGSTGAIFIYSGTPAHGNLIGSWAGAAGTDASGNSYPEGLNVSQGAISGTAITGSTFDGSDFIINASGSFFYNGTPAAGSLISSIAAAAGTDAYGNAYLAGTTSYNENAPGFWAAVSLTQGVVTWNSASTYAGPWTLANTIGFSTGGEMILDASAIQLGGLSATIPTTAPPMGTSGFGGGVWTAGQQSALLVLQAQGNDIINALAAVGIFD